MWVPAVPDGALAVARVRGLGLERAPGLAPGWASAWGLEGAAMRVPASGWEPTLALPTPVCRQVPDLPPRCTTLQHHLSTGRTAPSTAHTSCRHRQPRCTCGKRRSHQRPPSSKRPTPAAPASALALACCPLTGPPCTILQHHQRTAGNSPSISRTNYRPGRLRCTSRTCRWCREPRSSKTRRPLRRLW